MDVDEEEEGGCVRRDEREEYLQRGRLRMLS